ncbi:MAG TPA: FAD-binding oxidoreductase [Flavobacterium sp.]|nr:FAD-binding oxidoreductase [Flavobacterium sp.]
MVDYLIIGCGLAGIAFAETALKSNKSVKVFDDNSQLSSRVAGGLYNPVILKRFSGVWNAQQQIDVLNSFYGGLEGRLNKRFNFKIPIYRKLSSAEEQNNWFQAADRADLSPFLAEKLVTAKYSGIYSPFHFGEVLQTGYVDTGALVSEYHAFLMSKEMLVQEAFDYGQLKLKQNLISYKDIKARHIVFAEGFGMLSNPYFGHLPLNGTKGEMLVINAPDLKLDAVVKTGIFIIPLGGGLYKAGATYNWHDKTNAPTDAGKQELIKGIRDVIGADFKITAHWAGIRPTVTDRRPLVGTHPSHSNMHLLNGLGSRGVMLAPSMAKDLFEHIECQKPLDASIDIRRFKKIKW